MKRLISVAILAVCAAGIAVAQDGLQLSGELKTGFFWYNLQRDGQEEPDERGFIHNSEDDPVGEGNETLAGYFSRPGRFRLNFQYDKGIIGTKFRFETVQWPSSTADSENRIYWAYAFVYGNFFNNNLKVSAGKMGDSPWGSGGPEMWRELDTTIGIRFEFIPQFIPFIAPGSLNLGFVLNNIDGPPEEAALSGYQKMTLGDILNESVIGFSYTHDYFLVRFAYRLDGLADGLVREKMLYRVEERIIQKYLPGFQIWLNGYWDGLNPRKITYEHLELGEPNVVGTNWLYIQYDQDLFITQLRLGYDLMQTRNIFYARPNFFFKFFDNFLQAGAAFEYAADVGDVKLDPTGNSPYLHWYIEPQVRLNLTSNSYIALVYRYYSDYECMIWETVDGNMQSRWANTKTHWLNLRVLFTF